DSMVPGEWHWSPAARAPTRTGNPSLHPTLYPSGTRSDPPGRRRLARERSVVSRWRVAANAGGSVRTTILIVDDQATNRRLLVGSLEKAGHRTIEAADGLSALALAREHLPDLILMDVCMPELDGLSTCEKLKASESTAAIPVIFLTAQ